MFFQSIASYDGNNWILTKRCPKKRCSTWISSGILDRYERYCDVKTLFDQDRAHTIVWHASNEKLVPT